MYYHTAAVEDITEQSRLRYHVVEQYNVQVLTMVLESAITVLV